MKRDDFVEESYGKLSATPLCNIRKWMISNTECTSSRNSKFSGWNILEWPDLISSLVLISKKLAKADFLESKKEILGCRKVFFWQSFSRWTSFQNKTPKRSISCLALNCQVLNWRRSHGSNLRLLLPGRSPFRKNKTHWPSWSSTNSDWKVPNPGCGSDQ